MTTKTVYLFDENTGQFMGTYEAQANPLELGEYITPTHSTTTPVPQFAAGETAVFAHGVWVVVPIPADPSISPHVKTLEEAQAERIAVIDQLYASLAFADIDYLSTTFQADDASQEMISRVLSAQGGTAPAGFGYYDSANNKVLMTNAELQGLAGAILMRNQPLFETRQMRKAAIRAAATIEAVEAITW